MRDGRRVRKKSSGKRGEREGCVQGLREKKQRAEVAARFFEEERSELRRFCLN